LCSDFNRAHHKSFTLAVTLVSYLSIDMSKPESSRSEERRACSSDSSKVCKKRPELSILRLFIVKEISFIEVVAFFTWFSTFHIMAAKISKIQFQTYSRHSKRGYEWWTWDEMFKKTFIEAGNSCCAPRFPVIVLDAAKLLTPNFIDEMLWSRSRKVWKGRIRCWKFRKGRIRCRTFYFDSTTVEEFSRHSQ